MSAKNERMRQKNERDSILAVWASVKPHVCGPFEVQLVINALPRDATGHVIYPGAEVHWIRGDIVHYAPVKSVERKHVSVSVRGGRRVFFRPDKLYVYSGDARQAIKDRKAKAK